MFKLQPHYNPTYYVTLRDILFFYITFISLNRYHFNGKVCVFRSEDSNQHEQKSQLQSWLFRDKEKYPAYINWCHSHNIYICNMKLRIEKRMYSVFAKMKIKLFWWHLCTVILHQLQRTRRQRKPMTIYVPESGENYLKLCRSC